MSTKKLLSLFLFYGYVYYEAQFDSKQYLQTLAQLDLHFENSDRLELAKT